MHTNATETETVSKTDDGEFSFMEFLIVLAKHKKVIVGLPIAAAVIAVGLSFAIPNVYRASTKLLPPQQAQSGAAALLSQLGGVAAIGAAGIKNPNDLYIGMLRSRTVADNLIKQFDLKRRYGTESAEEVRRNLDANTFINAGKDGLITIDVEDEDQKFVANLANSYVDELIKLTKVLAITEASQRRVFFEAQLERSKNNLAAAEVNLTRTLEKNGVISVDSDIRTMVETVSRVRAQISAKEIQISSMQAFVTPNNQEYKRAQEELNSLRAEQSKLENGRPVIDDKLKGDSLPTGLENIKNLREVKYHQMLYEILSKQYEVARMDEAKDSAIIQVLDKAIEPERKFKPKRAIFGMMAAFLVFFASIGWALMMDAKQKALDSPMKAAQWYRLRSLLRLR